MAHNLEYTKQEYKRPVFELFTRIFVGKTFNLKKNEKKVCFFMNTKTNSAKLKLTTLKHQGTTSNGTVYLFGALVGIIT